MDENVAPQSSGTSRTGEAGRCALRSALLYTLFGGLWILFSDGILAALVHDAPTLTRLQMCKGWFFVGVTAVLVWWFVRIHLLALAGTNARLLERTTQLKTSLAERDILLREIHHRVMNNLQVMVGLLNLSRDRVEECAALPALDAAIARIYGMALIHSELYGSNRLDQVDMARFTHDLFAYLAGRHAGRQVEVAFDLDPVELHIEKAVPCGLLLGEALSNVFDHAFAPGTRGRVTVRFKSLDGQRVLLAVQDNGRGLDPARGEGVGLGLIRSLAAQLKAEFSLSGQGGVGLAVEFSAEPPRPRF